MQILYPVTLKSEAQTGTTVDLTGLNSLNHDEKDPFLNLTTTIYNYNWEVCVRGVWTFSALNNI